MKANTTISIASADGSRIEEIPAFFQRKQLNGFDAWTQLRTFDPAAPDFGKTMSTLSQLNGESLRVLLALMATSNSPICGHPNSPSAGRVNYASAVVLRAMRAAASLSL